MEQTPNMQMDSDYCPNVTRYDIIYTFLVEHDIPIPEELTTAELLLYAILCKDIRLTYMYELLYYLRKYGQE